MHIQTHLMTSWCLANLGCDKPRDRFLCTLVGVLPDLDGAGILISQEAYWDYHHILCHNLLFGFVVSCLAGSTSAHRMRLSLCCLLAFHAHLAMDLLGSGEGWQISYLWPFLKTAVEFPWAWSLYSWQNFMCGVLALAATLFIALRKGRTFMEYPMPFLDGRIVAVLRRYSPRWLLSGGGTDTCVT